MLQATAKILIERFEAQIADLKEGRNKEALVLIEQIELAFVVLKNEIEKEEPIVSPGPEV